MAIEALKIEVVSFMASKRVLVRNREDPRSHGRMVFKGVRDRETDSIVMKSK